MIYLNEKYKKLPKQKDKTEYIYFLLIGNPQDRVFKIGTTNDMDRRMKEHERYYKTDITVLWFKKVTSKWTTLRVEEENKKLWKSNTNWTYLRNDRFIIPQTVSKVDIIIRKNYEIDFNCNCYCIV